MATATGAGQLATPARGQRGGRGGFPAPRPHPARLRFRPARPAARSLSRHVFRGQRERPAAPSGAVEAGGRRGEDQGERLPSRTPAPAPPPTEWRAGDRGPAEVEATRAEPRVGEGWLQARSPGQRWRPHGRVRRRSRSQGPGPRASWACPQQAGDTLAAWTLPAGLREDAA